MDDDCPKVRELNNRYRSKAPVESNADQVKKPAQAKVVMAERFEEKTAHQAARATKAREAPPSVLTGEGRAMTVEAIRRLEELDEFLIEALSDGDRAEGRGLVQRVIRALDIPKDTEINQTG